MTSGGKTDAGTDPDGFLRIAAARHGESNQRYCLSLSSTERAAQ